MTDFARRALFACLSLVLGQLALSGSGSAAAAGVCVAEAAADFEHAPHPATVGARAILPDRSNHRLATAPLAAAAAVFRAPTDDAHPAVERLELRVAARAAALLPPARAPPLHS